MKKLTLFATLFLTLGLAACGSKSSKEEPWEPYVPVPREPITFKNYKIAVKFTESGEQLPDYVSSYVTGTFNSWTSKFKKGDDAQYKLKLDTALGENVYSTTIPEVDPDTIMQFKVISIATSKMTPDSSGYCEVGWSYESGDSSDESGYNNVSITAVNETPIVKTLDVVNIPPEPSSDTYKFTVNVTFTDYDATTYANYSWVLKGAYDGWVSTTSPTIEGQTLTFVVNNVEPGTYEFGIDEKISGTWNRWYGNYSFTMTNADVTVSYTGTVGNIVPAN